MGCTFSTELFFEEGRGIFVGGVVSGNIPGGFFNEVVPVHQKGDDGPLILDN